MFEEDPEAYGFRQVGYIAAVPERQADDLVAIRAQHERAGYESELVTGAEDCREYLSWTWPDWEAPVAALLHERRGGWADALQTVRQLAARARAAGAEIREDTEVVGVEHDESGASAVLTADGERLACETLVLAPGPWAARLLALRGGRARAGLLEGAGGRVHAARRGAVRPRGRRGAGGAPRPVAAAALRRRRPRAGGRALGHLLPHGPHRHGHHRRRAAGAARRAGLDPYGPDNPGHAAEPAFREFFASGLASALRRFRGRAGDWKLSAAGGIVAHTPDNYPVCDWVLDNVYAIIDSGHGFKTLAVGRLAAEDMSGPGEPRLEPFRLERFARGELHAASKGPYPWT